MVTWWHSRGGSNANLLGTAAQVTAVDIVGEYAPSGDDFGDFTLVGGQIFFTQVTGGVDILTPPEVLLMVIPAGVSIPSMTAEGSLDMYQDWCWIRAPMVRSFNAYVWNFDYKFTTKRSFKKGSRLVILLINRGQSAFGATSPNQYLLDAYVQE